MTKLLAVLLLLVPLAAPAFAQPARLSGTLVGSGGRPIAVSHVHVHRWPEGEIIASTAADTNGNWSLELDATGVFVAWFSGLGHRGERVGILLNGEDPEVGLDVRLGRHEWRDGFDQAALIGDFNDFAVDRGTLALRARADGLPGANVATDADTLAYQFVGVALTGPIEDPLAQRFVPDGTGGYRSVVDVDRSFASVIFDPNLFTTSGEVGGDVRFTDPSGPAGRFGLFTGRLFDRVDAYFERRARAAAGGATLAELREIYESYDPASDAALVAAALAAEPDPRLRDLILVTYMAAPIKTDTETATEALKQIPPASAAWLIQPAGLAKALSAAGDRGRSRLYALDVLRSPAPGLERSDALRIVTLAWLLEDALARASSDELEAYHAWLVGEYPNSEAAAKAAALYAPDRLIQPGQLIPDFEVRSMEDSTVTFSRSDFAGKLVMLDFWATWCGPCISEMPYMHAAFEKYATDGFTILSLSFDLAREDVDDFRSEGDWPMPWLHVFVEQGQESEFAISMDVVNIPRAILIGRDGTILATNESLRGERLDETLSRVLRGEN